MGDEKDDDPTTRSLTAAGTAGQRSVSDDKDEKTAYDDGQASRASVAGEDLIWLPEGYKPRENDVVCGRASHRNILFLKLIQDNMYEYAYAQHCRLRRSALVTKVLHEVFFIKLHETRMPRRYYRLPEYAAREKICQAFRDKLAVQYRSSNRTRRNRRRKQGLLPCDFEPCDTGIVIFDDRRENHPGLQVLDSRILELLPAFSAASLSEREKLVSTLYQELIDQECSFLHRRKRENYRWHRMSTHASKMQIHRLFQMKLDTLNVITERRMHRNLQPPVLDCADFGNNESLAKGYRADSTEKKNPATHPGLVLHVVAAQNDQISLNLSGFLPQVMHEFKKVENIDGGKEREGKACPNRQDHANLQIQAQQLDAQAQYELALAALESADHVMTLSSHESSKLSQESGKLQVEAVQMLQSASEQGHAGAQFSLAQCLHYGIGMQQNMGKAVELYCQAAAQFHVKSGNGELPDAFLTTQEYIFPES